MGFHDWFDDDMAWLWIIIIIIIIVVLFIEED